MPVMFGSREVATDADLDEMKRRLQGKLIRISGVMSLSRYVGVVEQVLTYPEWRRWTGDRPTSDEPFNRLIVLLKRLNADEPIAHWLVLTDLEVYGEESR